MKQSSIIMPNEYSKLISQSAKDLLSKGLVAIYEYKNGNPQQIGTGFLIKWKNTPTLITAKHVLFGYYFNEIPDQKCVFLNGNLRAISECNTKTVSKCEDYDICCVQIKDFSLERCIKYTALSQNIDNTESYTIFGYLTRDFKYSRNNSTFNPKHHSYSGPYYDAGSGYIGLKFNSKVINTNTEQREKPAIPRGLSGCPILVNTGLLLGNIKIVGVFTEERKSDGYIYGENSTKIIGMLDKI